MLNKKLGQHFLHDEAVLADIARALAPAAGDTLLEIGGGGGALTAHLQQSGADLTVLEVDRRFAESLRQKYDGNPRVRILHADALAVDWREAVGGGSGGEGKVRLVGNLPYNISTPLLLKMTQCADWLTDCHIMVQREVASRVCAPAAGSDYGRLSVSVQLFFQTQHLFDVPAAAFTPPPQVASSVLRLRPLPPPTLPPHFWQVLAAAFGKRRKTLKNALAETPIDWAHCPIDAGRRAQTLTPQEFMQLAEHFIAEE